MTVPLEMVTPDKTPPIPNPKALSLQTIQGWVIATKDRPVDPDGVYWCLVSKDYEAVSRNGAEVDRWVTEARWRMDYYREETKDKPADLEVGP